MERQACGQIDIHTGTQTDRQAQGQTHRQTGTLTDGRMDGQIYKHTDWQIDRQADIKADRRALVAARPESGTCKQSE